MKITDKILKVENDLMLYRIDDGEGVKVWETVRYSINTQLLRNSRPAVVPVKSAYNSTLLFTVKRIWRFMTYTLSHIGRHTLLIMNSRALEDGKYCDIIADYLYEIADKKDVFIVETSNNWCQKNYKYGKVCPSIMTLLFRWSKKNYDFSCIINAIENRFEGVKIDKNECDYFYKMFYAQYTFYKKFLKICRFNRIIFVQNGIYKGLIAASQQNNIKTIELQHGQISCNHFAYSYPMGADYKKSDTYNPDYLLTFGPLWLRDSSLPGTTTLPLGNNYYAYKKAGSQNVKKKVLVVSSIIHAEKLMKLISEISSLDSSFHFYYKLHPDEFKLYNKYIEFFKKYPNVDVIKNEKSITDLLSIIEIALVVQSTVMVETLNAGKRVFVYRIMDYEVMDFLYNEKGIYFIDEANSFLATYNNMDDVTLPEGRFFMPFDEEIGRKIIGI